MSYHESYEFCAIDRCLTRSAMRSLRAISTRASITPTRFYNSYDWGGLKAEPYDLLRRYFDVFVYTEAAGARWGMLRFPTRRIELARWRPCVASQRGARSATGCASLATHREFTILTMGPPADMALGSGSSMLQEVDEDGWGELASDGPSDDAPWSLPLALVRSDLLAGDLRALYLLWLRDVQCGDRPMTDREPIRPGKLTSLTGMLCAFAEFVRLDPDLLAVALEAPRSALPRTAGGLLRSARSRVSEQRRRAADRAAASRARGLTALEKRHASEWIAIERLVSSSKVKARAYEDIVRRLEALYQLSADRGTTIAFGTRVDALLDRHPTKAALRRRLRDVKLTQRKDRD